MILLYETYLNFINLVEQPFSKGTKASFYNYRWQWFYYNKNTWQCQNRDKNKGYS